MSRNVKTLVLFIVIILTTLLSLAIVVDKKIEPTEIGLFVKRSLKEVFPNSKIEVGNINYSMGTVVRVYVNDLQIGDDVVKVDKITCKIPLLSVIFGGSTIQVLIDRPIIKSQIKNKFSLAAKLDSKVTFEVPAFISKNKIDFKISEVQSISKIEKVKISKVYFKNFSLRKSMAYEIKAKVKTDINGMFYDADSKVIGEINLSQLNKESKLNSDVLLELDNIIGQDTIKFPRIRGRFKLQLEKIDQINGSGELSQDGVLESKFNFQVNDNKVSINDIQGTFQNNTFFDLLNEKNIKNISGNNSVSIVSGKLDYNHITNEIHPYLKVDIKKPFNWGINKFTLPTTLYLELVDRKIDLKLSHEFQQGIIASDLELIAEEDFKIKKITGDLNISNVVIDRNFILALENREKESSEVIEVDYQDKKKELLTIDLNINASNNLVGKAQVDISGKLLSDRKRIKLNDLKLKTPGGEAAGKIHFLKQAKELTFDIKAKTISLKEFKPLMNLLVPNFAGILSGKFKGTKGPKKYKYDVSLNIDDFAIGLVDLSKSVNDFLIKIGEPQLYSDEERLNTFKKIKSDFTLHSNGLILKSANLISSKVALTNVRGEIKRDNDSKIMGVLKTNKKIPFKYTGKDHVLNPDLKYTKKKLK